MTGIVVAGGRVQPEFLLQILEKEKKQEENLWLLAVDGGLAVLQRAGLCPQEIVGDFDTVSPEVLAYYQGVPDIVWQRHRPEKDATDTELALEEAKRRGCERVLLLGATGGRLDHELSNIQLLNLYADASMKVEILDEKNRITLLAASTEPRRRFCKSEQYGHYISFVPLSEKVRGITLRGFQYPLTDRDITIGSSLCISNELTEEEGSLQFCEGTLLCIESKD
ncbi:MAG: thiamine diphosphokinase [bacterium]|nr:thiamine diphosphokinase [bacterium]